MVVSVPLVIHPSFHLLGSIATAQLQSLVTMASASLHTPQPTVLVVDFGAQYAQLIARRVREAQVYSEIVPHRISASEVQARKPSAIILSGGPASVHVEGAPILDREIFELGIPILGICYGAQLIAQQLGGVVARGGRGEYGRTQSHRTTGAASQLLHEAELVCAVEAENLPAAQLLQTAELV